MIVTGPTRQHRQLALLRAFPPWAALARLVQGEPLAPLCYAPLRDPRCTRSGRWGILLLVGVALENLRPRIVSGH